MLTRPQPGYGDPEHPSTRVVVTAGAAAAGGGLAGRTASGQQLQLQKQETQTADAAAVSLTRLTHEAHQMFAPFSTTTNETDTQLCCHGSWAA